MESIKEEEKILRMVKLRNEMWLNQTDVCDMLMSIKKACRSLDAKEQFKELLKTLGCEVCEGEECAPK